MEYYQDLDIYSFDLKNELNVNVTYPLEIKAKIHNAANNILYGGTSLP